MLLVVAGAKRMRGTWNRAETKVQLSPGYIGPPRCVTKGGKCLQLLTVKHCDCLSCSITVAEADAPPTCIPLPLLMNNGPLSS